MDVRRNKKFKIEKNTLLRQLVFIYEELYISAGRRNIPLILSFWNRLCGLVVRVSGYRSRDPGFNSRPYQIF
jgi:hypothetical protein